MSFKTNRAQPSASRLSGFSLLLVDGRDAGAFLQAQTMNDVRALEVGRWHWNGWLNAKGRVIALFALLRVADEEFVMVLPDQPAPAMATALQRFVFRSKLRLVPMDDLVAAAESAQAGSAEAADHDQEGPPDAVVGNRQTGFRLDFSGSGATRFLRLEPAASPLLLPADPAVDAGWFRADLVHGFPRLGASQVEAWTPQMLSLDRLGAFSLRKGCYPGQEIVARTHYLGQAKRGLARVEGAPLQIGAELRDASGEPMGTVLCATPEGSSGLAVVRLDKLAGRARVGDADVLLPALFDGLQRPV